MNILDFSDALRSIRGNQKVTREGWNGKHFIRIQRATKDSMITGDYIVIHTESGDVMPWLASQADLLAGDWYLV